MNPNENKICTFVFEAHRNLSPRQAAPRRRRETRYRQKVNNIQGQFLPKENIGCPRFFLLGGESKQVRVPFSRVINS